jgi:beta-mannanase
MNFKQKFEPPGNNVIHGAGQNLETFTRYWNAVGKYKPHIYMTYIKIQHLEDWIKNIKVEFNKFPNLMLQIGLNLRINGEDKTKEISEGKYDKEIKKLAEAIKEIKNPVFIRIGYEFDKEGKYFPEDYVTAFRYITNYLRSKADNVATVWCSCPYPGTVPFEPYYPGDKYVDWFGIDVFGEKFFKNNKYEPTERFLKMAVEHKKPVMVGESSAIKIGIANGEQIWKEWFKPYFRWIQNHPQIKAFCYINWDWAKDWKTPRWGNSRIEENEFVRKKYVKELSKKKYIHNLLK